ncbi:hypothetical protein GCM10012284_19840 [Mangrovihabitans endophyticus]|uniref:Uncharacterized protein n=1 Tax=Mangrovihabitans endophyticus TaxID=1751298 RepID=A0A8J3BZ86_9ACTN|nr:hypothetical protein GCM10012284_19840 [Mangrovihabitans endophyticus]
MPPMDEEPPREFVAFVAVHLRAAQREAARLTGGPQHAHEISGQALADVGLHWRRLAWWNRLSRRDGRPHYLDRRLAIRARHWRADQIYPVEVQVGPAANGGPARPHAPEPTRTPPPRPRSSVALRKTALLPPTMRAQRRCDAEAAIAWADAYRRHRHHVYARVTATVVLMLVAAGHLVAALPD